VNVRIDQGEKAYKSYPGLVTWISPKSEFTPKTIQTKNERANLVYAIKVRVKNDGFLKIGMYGEVTYNEYMSAVTLEHISKTYEQGKVQAVSDVSFDVKAGELFGLIGPDGAGKTSIFRVLTTVLLADKGTASVAGYDVVKDYRAIRNRVGYMPGKFSLTRT